MPKTYPFSTSEDEIYKAPEWAKALLYNKYQLKKDTCSEVLLEFAIRGNHSDLDDGASELPAGSWLNTALAKDLDIEPFTEKELQDLAE